MTKPMIKLHDADTDTVIEREMTDKEYAFYLEENEKSEQQAKTFQELQTKKLLAQAKLAALGLSEDDLKALGL